MKVRWQVDDGYVGGSRPHYLEVPLDEFQHCTTEQEVRDVLDEIVRDDFDQRIGFVINNEAEVVEAWKGAQGKKGDERG